MVMYIAHITFTSFSSPFLFLLVPCARPCASWSALASRQFGSLPLPLLGFARRAVQPARPHAAHRTALAERRPH